MRFLKPPCPSKHVRDASKAVGSLLHVIAANNAFPELLTNVIHSGIIISLHSMSKMSSDIILSPQDVISSMSSAIECASREGISSNVHRAFSMLPHLAYMSTSASCSFLSFFLLLTYGPTQISSSTTRSWTEAEMTQTTVAASGSIFCHFNSRKRLFSHPSNFSGQQNQVLLRHSVEQLPSRNDGTGLAVHDYHMRPRNGILVDDGPGEGKATGRA